MQQRVIGEVEAWDEVARVKGDLLRLGEEVVGVAVESEPADALHRDQFFRHDLRRVEKIEVEFVLVGFSR